MLTNALNVSRRRWCLICAVAGMLASFALLGIALRNRSEDNWIPVQVPYPGVGLTISRTFSVRYGGRFEVQVLIPRSSAEPSLDGPAWLPTQLTVTIVSAKFHTTQDISAVRRAGSTVEDVTYTGDNVMYLRRGFYDVRVRGGLRNPLFTKNGSIVQLARIQSVGQDLFYPLVELAAYALFALASLLILAAILMKERHGVEESRRNGTSVISST